MAAITFNDARRPPRALPTRAASMIEQTAALEPLDPDIISESIPAFFIGRNKAGLWVAREAHGRVGGIFLFKSSAVEFAKQQSELSRCALIYPSGTFELDIENRGNPLIAHLAPWLARARRRPPDLAAR